MSSVSLGFSFVQFGVVWGKSREVATRLSESVFRFQRSPGGREARSDYPQGTWTASVRTTSWDRARLGIRTLPEGALTTERGRFVNEF